MLAVSDDDHPYDTVEASALKAGEAGECNDVLGRKGEGETAWHIGDEAWLCNRGVSTYMTPSANCITNYEYGNL